jgi:type VI secretion system protein VasD
MVMASHSHFRAGFGVALASLFLALALGSCSTPPPPKPPPPPPPPPKPTIFQVNLAVALNVNPDARGRASPIVTRLYELKSLAVFQSADFFSLFDRDKDTLGNDLVAKEELVLRPGDNRQFKRELQLDTRFVAMVAGYRDIERSRWRASIPVPLNQTTPVTISVRELDISITQK